MSEEQARELMVSMWCSALFSVLMGLDAAFREWEREEGPGKTIPGLWKIVSDIVGPADESEKRSMAETLGLVAGFVTGTYPRDKK
jgi:hypothetical protein